MGFSALEVPLVLKVKVLVPLVIFVLLNWMLLFVHVVTIVLVLEIEVQSNAIQAHLIHLKVEAIALFAPLVIYVLDGDHYFLKYALPVLFANPLVYHSPLCFVQLGTIALMER
jgi:hypothetical protein